MITFAPIVSIHPYSSDANKIMWYSPISVYKWVGE